MRIATALLDDYWGEIKPDILDKGVGGREGAMLRLAREWARLGHDVTCFVPIKKSEDHFEEGGGVHRYVPRGMVKLMLSHYGYDAVVAWECPEIFEGDEAVFERNPVRLVEMQVAHMVPNDRMTKTKELTNGVCVLSNWHGQFLKHSGLDIPDEQFHVLPNCVDIEEYPLDAFKYKMSEPMPKQHRFVYSSSPDRGLWPLLKSWPVIRSKFPNAELLVGYGVTRWVEANVWSHNRQGEMAIEIFHLMKQDGVIDVGQLGRKELAELQLNATAWLYPADPMQPTETGCITAVENAAAGNPMIISDADCLEDEFGQISKVVPLPYDMHTWIDGMEEVLSDEATYRSHQLVGRSFAEERTWEKVAPKWINLFEKLNVS